MNRVTLFGRLGKDPELKQAGAMPVLKFSLATSERKKQGEQWIDHTEWHSIVMFGKRAEAMARLLTKGSQLVVEGSLRTSSWEKDGQKRYKTEVAASDVHLVKGERREQAQAASPATQAEPDFSVFDNDDIPF